MFDLSKDEKLNCYFYYSLLHLLDYEDTLDLSTWNKETIKQYNEYYNSEDNLIISKRTYDNNFKQLTQLIQLEYYHANPYLFFTKKPEKNFNVQNLFDHNYNWKQYSAYFFFRRLNFFQIFPEQPAIDISMENYFKVPACFFPLYYSIIAVFSSIKQDWDSIKKKILEKVFLFFYEFDRMGETEKIEKFEKHIKPFSEKSIFLFYECLLEHIWPNELYSLARPAEKRAKTLPYPSDFNLQLEKIANFYFIWQEDYNLFSQIKTDLETINNIADEQMGKYHNLYALFTRNGKKKFNEQSNNITRQELLKYIEQFQEQEISRDGSILQQAKVNSKTVYLEKIINPPDKTQKKTKE